MSERAKLTDRLIGSLVCDPGKPNQTFWDAGGKLGVRVSKTGTKTLCWQYRLAGNNPQTLTIGRWPAIKIEEARATAAKWEAERTVGHDPQIFHEFKRATVNTPRVKDVLQNYLDKKLKGETKRTAASNFKDIFTLYGEFLVQDFDRRVLTRYLRSQADWPGKCRSLIRNITAAYNFAHNDPDTPFALPPGLNPAASLREHIKLEPASTYATNFEPDDVRKMRDGIAKAYAEPDIWPFGIAVLELCLLTGARPLEIAGLRVDEIDHRPNEGVVILKKKSHKLAHKGVKREIICTGEAVMVLAKVIGFHQSKGIKGPWMFPKRKSQKNDRQGHILQMTHYSQKVTALCGVEFVPRNLRSAYINIAMDALGPEWEEIIASNCGHSVDVLRKHYRKHREAQKVAGAEKIGDAMALLKNIAKPQPALLS